MNCWEFINCGAEVWTVCPAYPDHGLDCWEVTGTRCGGGRIEMATREEKLDHCFGCDFYKYFGGKARENSEVTDG